MKRIHKVCTYLRQLQEEYTDWHCAECPEWQSHPEAGKVKCGNRAIAEEIINVFKTGNPWGKKNVKWPKGEK